MRKGKGILYVILALVIIGAMGNLASPDKPDDSGGSRQPSTAAVASLPDETTAAATTEGVLSALVAAPTSAPTLRATVQPTATRLYTVMERGDKGDDVEALQNRLIALGYAVGGADGIYGGKTEDAIESLQKQAGLKVTGKADGDTQAVIWDKSAPTAPPKQTVATVDEDEPQGTSYILNKSTKKFHYPGCSSVDQMKESNKIYFTGTSAEAQKKGYDPCKRCEP